MWNVDARKTRAFSALYRSLTAASTRRRSIAITRRSGRCSRPISRDATGDVLEAGSGTGQHVVEFARQSPAPDLVADGLRCVSICKASTPGGRIRACRTSSPRASSICRRRIGDSMRTDSNATEGSDRDLLRQCDPHRALAGGAKVCSPTPRRRLRPDGKLVPLRPVQARWRAHRAEQRSLRSELEVSAIRPGACATSSDIEPLANRTMDCSLARHRADAGEQHDPDLRTDGSP